MLVVMKLYVLCYCTGRYEIMITLLQYNIITNHIGCTTYKLHVREE